MWSRRWRWGRVPSWSDVRRCMALPPRANRARATHCRFFMAKSTGCWVCWDDALLPKWTKKSCFRQVLGSFRLAAGERGVAHARQHEREHHADHAKCGDAPETPSKGAGLVLHHAQREGKN